MTTQFIRALEKPKVHTASVRGFRQSAQKARWIIDLIRGKTVGAALNILKFTHNRAARPIEEVIKSAAANAVHAANRENETLSELELVICDARVDQGMAVSRWRPRSRGMANPYTRHYCHITIGLVAPEDVDALKFHRQVTSQKKTRIAERHILSTPPKFPKLASMLPAETEVQDDEAGKAQE
jgi:large subunit ribosomal protein L22